MIEPAEMSLPPVALWTLSAEAACGTRIRRSPPALRVWPSVPASGRSEPVAWGDATGLATGDACGVASAVAFWAPAAVFARIAVIAPLLTPSAAARVMNWRRSIWPSVSARCRSRKGSRDVARKPPRLVEAPWPSDDDRGLTLSYRAGADPGRRSRWHRLGSPPMPLTGVTPTSIRPPTGLPAPCSATAARVGAGPGSFDGHSMRHEGCPPVPVSISLAPVADRLPCPSPGQR